jgi:EKC/KEOPS complex subunit CGI121/TPRKB
MSGIYSATYDYHPAHLQALHIALFTNVTNAAQLRADIVRAATLDGAEGDAAKDAVNFAFINARLVRLRLFWVIRERLS